MSCRLFVYAAAILLLWSAPGGAQTSLLPPNPAPPGSEPQPGPPRGANPPGAATEPLGRDFCNQSVSFHLAPLDGVPDKFRGFVGIFSDAAWTPQLCAALIVENVAPDGTATIIYVFGPVGSSARGAGGTLNGTGIIRDGELKFQNTDGSQFAFKAFYSDLDGHLVTPKGDAFETIFKRSF